MQVNSSEKSHDGWNNYLKMPRFFSLSRKEVDVVLLSYKPCAVLDVGAGYGRISKLLQLNGFTVTSVDNNEKMIALLKKEGLKALFMDARNLRFPSDSFDLVVTDGLLEHFEDPFQIIREETRVTRRWVLNFVPSKMLLNTVLERIQRVPTEYRRSEEEWSSIHKRLFSKVTVSKLTRLLAIRCEK